MVYLSWFTHGEVFYSEDTCLHFWKILGCNYYCYCLFFVLSLLSCATSSRCVTAPQLIFQVLLLSHFFLILFLDILKDFLQSIFQVTNCLLSYKKYAAQSTCFFCSNSVFFSFQYIFSLPRLLGGSLLHLCVPTYLPVILALWNLTSFVH